MMGADKPGTIYIMDGRAAYDMDSAIVLSVCWTVEEAAKEAPDYGDDCWIYNSTNKDLFPANTALEVSHDR